jgi:hypothetical protein
LLALAQSGAFFRQGSSEPCAITSTAILRWERTSSQSAHAIKLLAGAIKIAEGLAPTSGASQTGDPAQPKEDAMLRTTLTTFAFGSALAAALTLAVAGSAQAQLSAAGQPYQGYPMGTAPSLADRYLSSPTAAFNRQPPGYNPYVQPDGHQQVFDRFRPGVTGIWPGDPRW